MLTVSNRSKVTFRFNNVMNVTFMTMSSWRGESSPNRILLTNFAEDQGYTGPNNEQYYVFVTIEFLSATRVEIDDLSLDQATIKYPRKFSVPSLDNTISETERRRVLNCLRQPKV